MYILTFFSLNSFKTALAGESRGLPSIYNILRFERLRKDSGRVVSLFQLKSRVWSDFSSNIGSGRVFNSLNDK